MASCGTASLTKANQAEVLSEPFWKVCPQIQGLIDRSHCHMNLARSVHGLR